MRAFRWSMAKRFRVGMRDRLPPTRFLRTSPEFAFTFRPLDADEEMATAARAPRRVVPWRDLDPLDEWIRSSSWPSFSSQSQLGAKAENRTMMRTGIRRRGFGGRGNWRATAGLGDRALPNDWRGLFRCGDTGRKFHDLDASEMDFGPFGLQAEVALLD